MNLIQIRVDLFTSSITTVICTTTNSIITSTIRAFYENGDFDMNDIFKIGATSLRIEFAGHTRITGREIFGDLLAQSKTRWNIRNESTNRTQRNKKRNRKQF